MVSISSYNRNHSWGRDSQAQCVYCNFGKISTFQFRCMCSIVVLTAREVLQTGKTCDRDPELKLVSEGQHSAWNGCRCNKCKLQVYDASCWVTSTNVNYSCSSCSSLIQYQVLVGCFFVQMINFATVSIVNKARQSSIRPSAGVGT